ncbi:hypothetical protein ACTA71_006827 [Dictyostelium dimigraforme]
MKNIVVLVSQVYASLKVNHIPLESFLDTYKFVNSYKIFLNGITRSNLLNTRTIDRIIQGDERTIVGCKYRNIKGGLVKHLFIGIENRHQLIKKHVRNSDHHFNSHMFWRSLLTSTFTAHKHQHSIKNTEQYKNFRKEIPFIKDCYEEATTTSANIDTSNTTTSTLSNSTSTSTSTPTSNNNTQ